MVLRTGHLVGAILKSGVGFIVVQFFVILKPVCARATKRSDPGSLGRSSARIPSPELASDWFFFKADISSSHP